MQLIQSMNNERTETALASICDDLSFSMYVEESIVETIRELELKKSRAVNGNYDSPNLAKYQFELFFYFSSNSNSNDILSIPRRTFRVRTQTEIVHGGLTECG